MSVTHPSLLEEQWSEILHELLVRGDVSSKDTYILAGLLEYHYNSGITHAEQLKKVVLQAYREDREKARDREIRKEIRDIREAHTKRARKYHQDAVDQERIMKTATETSEVMDRYLKKTDEVITPAPKMSFLKKIALGCVGVGTLLAIAQLAYIWG